MGPFYTAETGKPLPPLTLRGELWRWIVATWRGTICVPIARWLAPDLARKAEMHDWLVSEISYEARWLGEFSFVSRTLDRLLSIKSDYFRPLGEPSKCKEESEISRYREALRRAST